MTSSRTPTWLVLGLPDRLYSGGSVRAGMIFSDLTRRASVIPVRRRSVADAVRGLARHSKAVIGPRLLANARMMPTPALRVVSAAWRPIVFDAHDHPVLQALALGVPLMADERAALSRAFTAHVAAFPVLIAQSPAFAALARLPLDRTIIVPNGADPHRFSRAPLPRDPTVGVVSGADPGRGIELLIEAVRLARMHIPTLRLRMALSATSESSALWLRALIERHRTKTWVDIRSLSYDDVPAFLAGVSVAAIPHPPGEYLDAVLPVKLFDSMMAGRPVVTTPRRETAAIVRAHAAGEVATGDAPEELADAIVRLLEDPERATKFGRNARQAALENYAWPTLSERISHQLVSVDASLGV